MTIIMHNNDCYLINNNGNNKGDKPTGLVVVAEIETVEGKRDELLALTKDLIDHVEKNEHDTLTYLWYLFLSLSFFSPSLFFKSFLFFLLVAFYSFALLFHSFHRFFLHSFISHSNTKRLESTKDANRIVVFERYTTKEAFEKHTKEGPSQAFAKASQSLVKSLSQQFHSEVVGYISDKQ